MQLGKIVIDYTQNNLHRPIKLYNLVEGSHFFLILCSNLQAFFLKDKGFNNRFKGNKIARRGILGFALTFPALGKENKLLVNKSLQEDYSNDTALEWLKLGKLIVDMS